MSGTILTAAAVLALASTCQHTFAPKTILAIAQQESGLNAAAVHINRDGSTDRGLMQINDRNFGFLGMTPRTAENPCASIAAAEAILRAMSGYNSGSPTKSLTYALAVNAREHSISVDTPEPPAPAEPPPPPPCAPAWDAWALAACSKLQASAHPLVITLQEPVHAN